MLVEGRMRACANGRQARPIRSDFLTAHGALKDRDALLDRVQDEMVEHPRDALERALIRPT